ncbi:MAG: hypothetical protein HKN70_13725 [Gammaproteobacteria bacterium]|nr:hypothetical protein [Gammaproteobacteria bacterium]
MKQHWLVRRKTIRVLWFIFIVVLSLTVVAGLFADEHAVFGIDGSVAFNAWFGFVSCVAMVVIAKLFGRLACRKEDYYDRS